MQKEKIWDTIVLVLQLPAPIIKALAPVAGRNVCLKRIVLQSIFAAVNIVGKYLLNLQSDLGYSNYKA